MGLLFQDHIMRTVSSSYPEVLLFDATYKLTDLRMPLYLLMAFDSNGHAEIAGVYLTVNETATLLRQMLTAFKRLNDSWERTSVMMRPSNCLFHTLRSFKRVFDGWKRCDSVLTCLVTKLSDVRVDGVPLLAWNVITRQTKSSFTNSNEEHPCRKPRD